MKQLKELQREPRKKYIETWTEFEPMIFATDTGAMQYQLWLWCYSVILLFILQYSYIVGIFYNPKGFNYIGIKRSI